MTKDLNGMTVTMSEHTKNLNWKMRLLKKKKGNSRNESYNI